MKRSIEILSGAGNSETSRKKIHIFSKEACKRELILCHQNTEYFFQIIYSLVTQDTLVLLRLYQKNITTAWEQIFDVREIIDSVQNLSIEKAAIANMTSPVQSKENIEAVSSLQTSG